MDEARVRLNVQDATADKEAPLSDSTPPLYTAVPPEQVVLGLEPVTPLGSIIELRLTPVRVAVLFGFVRVQVADAVLPELIDVGLTPTATVGATR